MEIKIAKFDSCTDTRRTKLLAHSLQMKLSDSQPQPVHQVSKSNPSVSYFLFFLTDKSLCRPCQEKWLLLSAFAVISTFFFPFSYITETFFPLLSLIDKRTFSLGISGVFFLFRILFLICLLSPILHFSSTLPLSFVVTWRFCVKIPNKSSSSARPFFHLSPAVPTD